MTVKLSDEDRAEIVRLTAAGVGTVELAARYGVTRRTIGRVREAHGVSKPPKPRYSAELLESARELLEDGCSYNEVGRTLDIAPQNLARRLPGYAWPPQQAGTHARLVRELGGVLERLEVHP